MRRERGFANRTHNAHALFTLVKGHSFAYQLGTVQLRAAPGILLRPGALINSGQVVLSISSSTQKFGTTVTLGSKGRGFLFSGANEPTGQARIDRRWIAMQRVCYPFASKGKGKGRQMSRRKESNQ